MEFNQASGKSNHSYYGGYYGYGQSRLAPVTTWETDYQVIQDKYRKSGYMKVPEIVFWNLRDSSSTPVLGQQKGVALVSGFSKNLLKLFLEGSDLSEFTPIRVMEKAIAGEGYNKLVVVD
ncbi:hypothetical protein C5167_014355 [Papaver somniferum]|uniref:DUF7788 domain-containing protein n=1 Tax=Papaver somniferum TaxID=3469 RepID=A0A4Y7J779_PAPSO|nr:hypothetical protein C5167_014355 [Papaver somniferum]